MSRTRTPRVFSMYSLQRAINSGVESPEKDEGLETYLNRLGLLGYGFSYRELVSWNPLSRRHRKPPRHMWPNLALTLVLANEFRARAIEEAGVKGLRVAAAYRPRGGAARSAHKVAKALDLDRIGGDPVAYYECASRMWSDLGPQLDMGLGLYTAPRLRGGVRVHIDTNHGLRTWQITGGRQVKPWDGKPLSRKLIADMGLPDPLERRA